MRLTDWAPNASREGGIANGKLDRASHVDLECST
jgi:hypothetical protein